MHEAIKQAIGFEGLANCESCPHIEDVSDGWEYGQGPYYVCSKPGKQHMGNLRGFPFKTEQKCWSPQFWISKFTDMIEHGEDEEREAAREAYYKALEAAGEDAK